MKRSSPLWGSVSVLIGVVIAILALVRGAQGLAYLRGREFVSPDLVKAMAEPVLAHRLIVRPQATAMGQTARAILASIMEQVLPPV